MLRNYRRAMMRTWMWPLIAGLATACGVADPEAQEQRMTDGATVSLDRQWLLLSDGLTAGDPYVDVSVQAFGRDRVQMSIGDGQRVTVAVSGGVASAKLELAGLGAGVYDVTVWDRGSAIGRASFNLSAALYVVVSTDWDDTRMSDAYLQRMEELRERHPSVKITQFFAPYHYTDPQLSETRRDDVEAWVKHQRDVYGDEIGVHVHGWCHFIDTTGVDCKTAETFYKDDGSGYTTILAAYPQHEMEAILDAAVDTFEAHGLGRPTSFRAGGWTADVSVLRALEATGFEVDTSAVPAHRLSSWQGYDLYSWTMNNWAGITEVSQPYYPLPDNIVQPDPQRGLAILEVPDNGVLVDYVTADDMVAIYDQNHDGGTLDVPTMYQVGWHPPNFSHSFMQRMDVALDHVDAHLYEHDRGPAVYVNISDLTQVWRL
jgi:hypothetical protein